MWQGGLCNMKLILMSYTLGVALVMALPGQELPVPRPNCIRMTPETERQIDLIVEKLGHFLNTLSIEHEHFDIRLIKLSIEQHTEDEVEEKETVLQLSVNDCQLSDYELEEIDHHREVAKQHEKEREAKVKQEQQVEKPKLAYTEKQKSENLKNGQKTYEDSENLDVHEQTKEKTKNKQGTSTSNENSDANGQEESKTLQKTQERQENVEDISKTYHENQNIDLKPEAADRKEAEKLKNNDGEARSGKNFEVLYLDLDENGQELMKAIGRKKKPQIVYVQERNSGQTEYWLLKRR